MAGGGIGKIDKDCAKKLLGSERKVSIRASDDEIGIFYNLSMDRACYFSARNALYFVESGYVNVSEIIRNVLAGMNITAVIEQLYLDRHNYFRGPLRLQLDPAQAKPVLVALQLNSIKVAVISADP